MSHNTKSTKNRLRTTATSNHRAGSANPYSTGNNNQNEPHNDEVSRIYSTIKTGDDAVNFFARYGSETPIKFIILVQNNQIKHYDPYDLIVTSYNINLTNIAHHIMSSTGIVSITPSEQSDSLPLSVWMKQKLNFNHIRLIPFFKYYLHRKIFSIWYENVKYQLFLKQRKKVVDRLFLIRKTTNPAIMSIKRHLREIRNAQLLITIPSDLKPFTKDSFYNKNISQLTNTGGIFEENMKRILDEVESVINEVNKMYTLAYQDPSSNILSYTDNVVSDKLKSLVRIKQEKAEQKQMKLFAKAEYLSLPDFIRYLDYLVVGNFFEVTIHGVETFYYDFVRPRKTGIFETMIRFTTTTSNTVFIPTCNEIKETINHIFEKLIETVANLNRVGHTQVKSIPNFNTPTLMSTYHGLANIKTILHENKIFRTTIDNIYQRILVDFEDAENYAVSYDALRPIYQFHAEWSLENYKNDSFDISKIKNDIEQIINWIKYLEKLKNKNFGIVDVDSRKLKNELNPMLERHLSDLKEYLKDLAKQKSIQLQSYYKDCSNKLILHPTALKDYINQISYHNKLKDEEMKLFLQTSQVDVMYNLLQSYEVAIPPENVVLHEELHAKQIEYRKEMTNCNQYHDNKRTEMIQTFDKQMKSYNEKLLTFLNKLDDPDYTMTLHYDDAETIIDDLDLIQDEYNKLDRTNLMYQDYMRLLQIPISDDYQAIIEQLNNAKIKLDNTKKLWVTIQNWNSIVDDVYTKQFLDLDFQQLNEHVTNYGNDLIYLTINVPCKATNHLAADIGVFQDNICCIMDLGNKNLKIYHYQEIFDLINQNYYQGMPFTLIQLKNNHTFQYHDLIHNISVRATGESELGGQLSKISTVWEKMTFKLKQHRGQNGIYTLEHIEEVYQQLEDHLVVLQSLLGSRFIAGVRALVEGWERKLINISEILDEWISCQRSWIYLENIFSAEDIQKQLPNESQKFQIIDRSWKLIMNKTFNDPLVVNCLLPVEHASPSNLLHILKINNETLEQIQKSLEEYLETKRMKFPRFYFLSNDELLEILSQTRNVQNVQKYIMKCFDSIKSLQFATPGGLGAMAGMGGGSGFVDIIGYNDSNGEVVELHDNVPTSNMIEVWLLAFEKSMRYTLYFNMKKAYLNYPKSLQGSIQRDSWLYQFPSQIVIGIDQAIWTQHISSILGRVNTLFPTMTEYFEFLLQQIQYMVELIRITTDKLQRILLGALLTLDVHNRDVTRALVEKNIEHINDFEWTKQLRYYWDVDKDNLLIKQTNTCFVYGYEYLGNNPRLVVTPLTDICYMTLTGALHMSLGGAPAGPAGTGKTETTKDLAKALAVYCVVFNCSDGLDYKIMARFFSGLAQQGAWACFDEFNRIDIEVLSVIAQQILTIQQAIIKRTKQFDFEGKMIPLNLAFGVFITMNPGYAGRTELPDNLKSLFRPVAMMVPDYRLIAEIMLFAEGFGNAYPLSNKMAQLYALSSEQLSKQSHYDFGMRAVKSVLVAAGQLKRKESDTNEEILLIRAMRDSNIPKFLEQDIPLFLGIISDLFPGIRVPFVDYGKLQSSIEATLTKMALQKQATFVTKVIQIHETQLVRHGIMLVGETGSGKTTSYKVLATALGQLKDDGIVDKDGFYQHVDCMVLNPKSITLGELYGQFNEFSHEWSDGLVPKIVRDCVNSVNEGSEHRKWVIFDGPVDAVWIESMNTVLDDNKTLCLANSERIKLPPTLHMMFEVQDLKVASPATVSRCGMVYMEQINIGLFALIKTWQNSTLTVLLSKPYTKNIISIIQAHIEVAINFVLSECQEKIRTTSTQLLFSFLNLLYSKLSYCFQLEVASQDQDFVSALVVWCLIWSIGANIHDNSRAKFTDWLKSRFNTSISSKYGILMNEPYACYLDVNTREVKPWSALVPSYQYRPDMSYFSITVPTVDTIRYTYLLDRLTVVNQHVLFCSETGMGKSTIINSFLNNPKEIRNIYKYTPPPSLLKHGSQLKDDPDHQQHHPEDDNSDEIKFIYYNFSYSAQTLPKNLQDIFESKLEKKRKTVLGPPTGKKMYFFIDDLNMPVLDTYGSQPVNELLRQVVDTGGYYDTQKLFFKHVHDVVFLSACCPPGGGRNEVSPRLIRRFHLIWLSSLQPSSLFRIFASILNGFVASCNNPPTRGYLQTRLTDCLVQASIDIYLTIQTELLPTPLKSHYTFNLRDLSKVFQGILMIKKASLNSNPAIIRLWGHECSRVFRDRLIDDIDRVWFDKQLVTKLTASLDKMYRGELDDIINPDYKAGESMTAAVTEGEEETAAVVIAPEEVNKYHYRCRDFTTLMYGNFAKRTAIAKEYQELSSNIDEITKIFQQYLQEFNMANAMKSGSRMELVFFYDCLNHLVRLLRILSQPRGNAVLVGVGGSGRQSLTKLSCYILEYRCFQIEITKGYGIVEWRESIKEILIYAGGQNKQAVFLFSDTQILNEVFLEDINNLLNSGEIMNIYAPEDVEKIMNYMRPRVAEMGLPETKDMCFTQYIAQIRDNLHIVLAMSPIGSSFRTRCRKFPSLVNCCTLDWYSAWPEDALYSVAFHILTSKAAELGFNDTVTSATAVEGGGDNEHQQQEQLQREESSQKSQSPPSNVIDTLAKLCNKLHVTVEEYSLIYFREMKRYNYTTPTSYIELIQLFIQVYQQQRQSIISNESRYRIGLQKLKETEGIVAELEQKLTDMQPVLESASQETEVLLIQVTADQQEADKQAAIIEQDVKQANIVTQQVQTMKDDCQADLDEAMPAYELAVKSLKLLDKKSIQELKGFNNPPELVKTTMEAICILFDRPTGWDEAKKLLSQMDFMDKLLVYDKDNIPPRLMRKLEKYYQDPKFVPDEVKKQSQAAMCLCMWARAMVVYDRVAKNIEPKKLALVEAQSKLDITTKKLNEKKAVLQEVLDRVAALRKTLQDTQQRKTDLENQTETAKRQLVRAGQLIGGLSGEKKRWALAADKLRDSLVNVVGDMCLAAGFLAYLGPFTSQFRHQIIQEWIKQCQELAVPHTTTFTLLTTNLVEPMTIRQWQIDGLPADDFSLENGILANMGRRFPLMIDPMGQANRWIRNTYSRLQPAAAAATGGGRGGAKGKQAAAAAAGGDEASGGGKAGLQVLKLTDKDLLRTLENSIRYGYPVLIENVGTEIDPILDPLLLKQIYTKAGQRFVRLGDNDVPYNTDLKLYLTTKLSNPHYLPETFIKVTIINFTVTMKGLEDQLLVDVVRHERPDLEEKKNSLVISIANDQQELLDIENQILYLLANASGEILDDEELITALDKSKVTSTTINGRLAEAEQTTQDINEIREGYRVVATRGSIIYFVIAELSQIDHMYQYSLQYYKGLYQDRLQKTEKKDKLMQRLQLLQEDITHSMYATICRGLFDKDKLLYAFMITSQIQLQSKLILPGEWSIFLTGLVAEKTIAEKRPYPVLFSPNQLKSPLARMRGPTAPPTPSHAAPSAFGSPTAAATAGGGGGVLANNTIGSILTEKIWYLAATLEYQLPSTFDGLCGDILGKYAAWMEYFAADRLDTQSLPGAWETRLNPFQKLLFIRVFREEGLVFAIRKFIKQVLGEFFTESPVFDLESAFNDSKATTPLLFLLSSGADPTDYLLQLAQSKNVSIDGGSSGGGGGGGNMKSLKIISLGQGQGPIAEKLIEAGQKYGHWVCLQNCHLAVSWLSRLEQIIEKMSISDEKGATPIHKDFRLWLTSMPTAAFPVSILQTSLKITNEPPRGLKASLMRTFNDLSVEDYDDIYWESKVSEMEVPIPTSIATAVDPKGRSRAGSTMIRQQAATIVNTMNNNLPRLNSTVLINRAESMIRRGSTTPAPPGSAGGMGVGTLTPAIGGGGMEKPPLTIATDEIVSVTAPATNVASPSAIVFEQGLSDPFYEIYRSTMKKLIFTVAFFNAIILERRKFGSIGWNIPYEWMNSDLKTAQLQIKMYIDEEQERLLNCTAGSSELPTHLHDSIPWETLNVSIAQIVYGGRVTDTWDKRTIGSLLRKYLQPALLQEGFQYTAEGTYKPPSSDMTLNATRDYISSLPSEDSPDVFDLHPNASITFQQKESKSLLAAIISCSGSVAVPSSSSSSKSASAASPGENKIFGIIQGILDRLPEHIDSKKAHPSTFELVNGIMNSYGVFLGQEINCFNALIAHMRHTLMELRKACKGEILMTSEYEQMQSQLLFQGTPNLWQQVSYPCLKPLASWFTDFLARVEFIRRWCLLGNRMESFWISSFYFPQSFITAIKQVFARKFKISIDTLLITCNVLNYHESHESAASLAAAAAIAAASTTAPTLHLNRTGGNNNPTTGAGMSMGVGAGVGALIYGLYIEGGRFNTETLQLQDSLPRVLIDPMPVMQLFPVLTSEFHPVSCYTCPLYKTSARAGVLSTTGHSTNFVISLPIPSQQEENYWVRRGCAMLCMSDD